MAHEVRSELPATVLEVLCIPSGPVAAGDMLLLLESMKMEIPIICEVSGSVGSVAVVVGDAVSVDDLMLTIDPAGQAPAAT